MQERETDGGNELCVFLVGVSSRGNQGGATLRTVLGGCPELQSKYSRRSKRDSSARRAESTQKRGKKREPVRVRV